MSDSENNIIARTGWLNGTNIETHSHNGECLGEIAKRCIPEHLWPFVRAQKNGIEFLNWRDYLPARNDHVLLYVLPQGGGDDGKSALGLIAQIGLAVFSAGIANVWLKAAVMVGGGLVMAQIQKSMIKPPVQPYDQSRSDPYFSFTGQSNQTTPMGYVPRVYGKIRMYPRHAGLPYPDGTGSYVMLFDFGYGPLHVDETSFMIGDTLLSKFYQNSANYQFKVHENFDGSQPLTLFNNRSAYNTVGATLINQGETVTRATALNAGGASLQLAFPQGLFRIRNDGLYVYTWVELRLEAQKIVNGVAGPWTPLTNFGTYNIYAPKSKDDPAYDPEKIYEPVTNQHPLFDFDDPFYGGIPVTVLTYDYWTADGYEYRGFAPGRSVITLRRRDWVYDSNNNTQGGYPLDYMFNVGQRFLAHKELGKATVTNISYPTVGEVDITFVLDDPVSEFKPDHRRASGTTVWGYPYELTEIQQFYPPRRYFYWQWWYEANGYTIIQGKYTQGFDFNLDIEFDEVAQYNIRITRVRPSSETFSDDTPRISILSWNSIYTISENQETSINPEVPHTLVELRMKATDEFNGQIDNFSAVVQSKLQVWDGMSWNVELTNNPAWIYCDVLCGTANRHALIGAERDRLLDIDRIKEWADYCDLPAPNDPSQPQFQCNLIVDGESTVKDTLQTVASVGRAAPARNDAMYSVVRENLDTIPVQLITPKNTSNFSATINYITQPHGLKVSFLDETENFIASEWIVYNDGYNKNNATQFETVNLTGTTRWQQCERLGRYFLAKGKLQREIIECNMDIENLVAQRGDVVLVAHDVLKAGGVPRRIVNIFGSVITLDEPVQAVGDPYFIDVVLLLHFDGDFTDSSAVSPKAVTNNNVTTTSTEAKWGESGDFIPAPDPRYLYIPAHQDFNFGVHQDFTIEAWIYWTDDTQHYQTIFANWFGPAYQDQARFLMVHGANSPLAEERGRLAFGGWGLAKKVYAPRTSSMLLSSTQLQLNTWYHVAVTRSGNVCRMFINGFLTNQEIANVNLDFSINGSCVGANGWDLASGHSFHGYIDDLRVTRHARYVASFDVVNHLQDPFHDNQGTIDSIRLRGTDDIIPATQLSSTQIIVAPQIAADLVEGDVLEYGITEEIRAPFIVEEITAAADFQASLSMVEQRLEIEDAVYGPIPDRDARPGAEQGYIVGEVRNLYVQFRNYIENAFRYSEQTLRWLPPLKGLVDYYRVYEVTENGPVNLGRTNNTFMPVGTINVSQLSDPLTRYFYVVPYVTRVGSGKPASTQITVQPDRTAPQDVKQLSSNAQTEALLLFWPPVSDADVVRYEIRYSSMLNATWETANRLVDEIPATATDTMVPLRPGKYFIKAVDSAGNYSVNAADTIAHITDLEHLKLYQSLTFNPYTNGIHDGTQTNAALRFTGTGLHLVNGELTGRYYPNESIHFSVLSKVRLTADLVLNAFAMNEHLDDPWYDPLATAVPISANATGIGINKVDAQIFYRFSDGTTPIDQIEWTRLVVADVTATDIEFMIELKTVDPTYTPIVSTAGVQVDLLQRSEIGAGVSIPAATTIINFTNSFFEPPSVTITLQGNVSGEVIEKAQVTKNGFAVTIRDSAGNVIAGTIDWVANGYGKEF